MADEHILPDDLYLYAMGQLSDADCTPVDRHIDACDECALSVVMYREVRDLEALEVAHLAQAHEGAAKEGQSGIKGMVAGLLGLAAGAAASLQPRHQAHGAGFSPAFGTKDDGDASHPSHEAGLHGSGDMHFQGYEEAQKQFGLEPDHRRSPEIRQSHEDTCAIQCQHLILNRFGVETSEEKLMHEAEVRDLYHPGSGTKPEDLGKLLESHGIPVHRELHANVFNLSNELAQGHQVMVGIDAGALWHQNTLVQSMFNEMGLGQANHAVIVSGIDTTDPSHIKVNITDPGTGHIAKQYDMREFLNAWHASDFCMVATTNPVPAEHPEMTNFDYHAGHIPMVGEAPYEFVHEMSDSVHQENGIIVHEHMEHLFFDVLSGKASLDAMRHGFGGTLFSIHDVVSNALSHFSGEHGHDVPFQDAHLHNPYAGPEHQPVLHHNEANEHGLDVGIHSNEDPSSGPHHHDHRSHDSQDAHADQDWQHLLNQNPEDTHHD